MKREKCRGSITVFAALSLMLVAQLIFTLLEAARNVEYHKVLQMNTDAVLESAFAGYCSPLWDKYRLVGLCAEDNSGDFSLNNVEAELRNLTAANLGSKAKNHLLAGDSLITAEMTDAQFSSYLLMTDGQGKVFEKAVVSYMKNNLAYEAAQALYSSYESAKEIRDGYGNGDASIGEALDSLDSIRKSADEGTQVSDSGIAVPEYPGSVMLGKAPDDAREAANSEIGLAEPAGPGMLGAPPEGADSGGNYEGDSEENLLTTVVKAKKRGILSLVLPKNAVISEAKMNLDRAVSGRTLERGIGGRELSGSWYDQVLMNRYLTHYLTDYTDEAADRGLNYELEYLIGGKSEDCANLKIAVAEILGIREAMNLASIVLMPERQSEALVLATLLAGVTVNPLIIEAVKYGILAAWAFAESVLDLRALLAGEKVAMMKSEVEWTSDLDVIPELLSGFAKAKSSPGGKNYRDYLSLLLFFHSAEKLAMRTMDVQEAAIRRISGYENFRMDCVICEAEVCCTYSYVPVFAGFVTLMDEGSDRLCIQRDAKYSYLENINKREKT